MARDEAYFEAEKKIEEAWRSGVKELDLRRMNLTELPESIGRLNNLEILWLGDGVYYHATNKNQLTSLPESLGNLRQLQSLDLSENPLGILPEWIGNLTQLQSLSLSNNQLVLLPDSLGQLTNLRRLRLSSNQLSVLPAWLGRLRQLRSLSLFSNELTVLPDWLGSLRQLQELDLSFNPFSVLPESISQLSQLHALKIGDNYMRTLPEWLSKMTQLRELSINAFLRKRLASRGKSLSEGLSSSWQFWGYSPFERTLPEWLGKLRQLQILNIGHNDLKELPEWISQLTQLKKLIAYFNHIKTLPKWLWKLEHLEELDLSLNFMDSEWEELYKQGLPAIMAYLRSKDKSSGVTKATMNYIDESPHKRKLKVFLCYASQDKNIVYELYQKLISEEWIEPWLDAKKLLPGQNWQAEIKNAVATADVVIIFLSRTSINKDGFIQKELRLAQDIALEKIEGSIFLIPLRLDTTEVPRSLHPYHWANYFGEEKIQSYRNLLVALRLRLEDIDHRNKASNL